MKLLTFFNLVRTLKSHPEVMKRVFVRMRREEAVGFHAALHQVRRAVALLFEEMKITGAVVAETDAAIAAWGD